MTTALIETPRISLYHADFTSLAGYLKSRDEVVDMVTVDAPYSERTHKGHDGTRPGGRSPIPYAFWTAEDVHVFMQTWRPITRGWFVSITDHVLWPAWQHAAERAGLYAGFPPIPITITGSRVRLRGDGPSPSSYFIMVARPKEFVTWGTIGRGSYYGKREPLLMTGAKPVWGMREIIQDYSRPGQLVCDPLCGTGTVAVAAMLENRDSLSGDGKLEPLLLAEDRIERMRKALATRRAESEEPTEVIQDHDGDSD